jgi:hypothetical protein
VRNDAEYVPHGFLKMLTPDVFEIEIIPAFQMTISEQPQPTNETARKNCATDSRFFAGEEKYLPRVLLRTQSEFVTQVNQQPNSYGPHL